MKYKTIGYAEKANAVGNRIQQIEAKHYSNEVYLMEAKLIGDKESVEKFVAENESLEERHEMLTEEFDRLSALVKESAEESEDGSTG